MAGRKVILTEGQFYHVFNRGLNQQKIFASKKDYERFFYSLLFYRFENLPIRLSHFIKTPLDKQKEIWERIIQLPHLVEIVAFVLMDNHFHLLLKQTAKNGITLFIKNLTNSYTRYYNQKYKRHGDLFEGVFKAVRIETEEQLIHVSRYIHLNPVVSYVVDEKHLESYPWSSLPFYLEEKEDDFIFKEPILNHFKDKKSYKNFVFNHIDYAKKLQKIKHLLLENH
jgi:putative transposase